jgi:hypothetical protein
MIETANPIFVCQKNPVQLTPSHQALGINADHKDLSMRIDALTHPSNFRVPENLLSRVPRQQKSGHSCRSRLVLRIDPPPSLRRTAGVADWNERLRDQNNQLGAPQQYKFSPSSTCCEFLPCPPGTSPALQLPQVTICASEPIASKNYLLSKPSLNTSKKYFSIFTQ